MGHFPLSKSGLHRFLVLVATVKLRHLHSDTPMWIKRWERNAWAHREGIRRFHVRFPAYLSDKDRQAARYESQWSNPRATNVVAYQWMHDRVPRTRR